MKISPLYTVIYRYQVNKYCLCGRNFGMKKLDFIVEISIIFRILEVTETILTTNYQWRVISKTSEKSLKYRFWPINLQNICPWSDTFLPIFSIDHDKWTIFASFAENSSLLLQKWLLHPIRFEFFMIPLDFTHVFIL